MKKPGQKESFLKRLFKPPLIVLTVIVVLVAILLGIYGYVYSGRNVYGYVKGEPIYNYEMSSEIIEQAYRNNVSLGSIQEGDPKSAFVKYTLTDFAKRKLFSDKLFYLMGLKDNYNCSQDELDKAIYEFKKNVKGISDNPLENFKSELELRGITEKQLTSILRESAIVKKETNKLTKDVTVTPAEVEAYYKEWSFSYEEKGKTSEEIFKEKYDKIEDSALYLKKQQYMNKLITKLIEENKAEIIIDNRYKKFMRWLYSSMLNLAVPDDFKPGEV